MNVIEYEMILEMIFEMKTIIILQYENLSNFCIDTPKFFAGVMTAMSAMLQLGIPHINVMTKMDLLGKKKYTKLIDRFENVDYFMQRSFF